MEHLHQFKRSLLRMLQTGLFAEMLGATDGCRAQIIFELQRQYHVHYTRHYVVLHECETETIRQHTNGRWRRQQPMTVDRGRLVIDRASGQLLNASQVERTHSAPRGVRTATKKSCPVPR